MAILCASFVGLAFGYSLSRMNIEGVDRFIFVSLHYLDSFSTFPLLVSCLVPRAQLSDADRPRICAEAFVIAFGASPRRVHAAATDGYAAVESAEQCTK